jgi:diguanylate cyclase
VRPPGARHLAVHAALGRGPLARALRLRRAMKPKPSPAPGQDGRELALDTVGAVLRSMAEFALDGESTDAGTFRRVAEGWAQHVLLAAAPPGPGTPAGGPPAGGPPAEPARPGADALAGRRDWEGVRRFVHDYCRSSSAHAASVTGDLRDVIWVFVRNFTQAFANDEATDGRLRALMARLEQLVTESDASELKREVLGTVGSLSEVLEERRERQRARMTSLGETVRALGDQLASARRDGETDPLTRLFNRKALDAYLEESVRMCGGFARDACLVLVDVDHFKGINDTAGHLTGDEVLRGVADALSRVFLRKSDFVARFGGDEFAVVLRDTPLPEAARLCDRVLSRVRTLRVPNGERQVSVTLSIGGAALTPEDDVNGWFARADRGLYAAKAAGRDRFVVGGPPLP